jgi:hypothetical protein
MTPEGDPVNLVPQRNIQHDSDLLPAVRELLSRFPETHCLDAHELQGTLWLLRYTDDLVPEAEIAAAVEVARCDFDPEEGEA